MKLSLSHKARSVYGVQEYGARPSIEGLGTIELRRFNDEGGSLIELMRLSAPTAGLEGFEPAQITYSTLQPGVVKAFHVHLRQTDVWFVPPEDRVLLVLADVRAGSRSEGTVQRLLLGDGRAVLVRIPAGVAHGCKNLGSLPAHIVYLTDQPFSADPATCDEGRLPWDYLGREAWDVPWD